MSERISLPSCGTEVVDRTVDGDVYDAVVRVCFLDAYDAGQPVEMLSEALTPEGGVSSSIIRFLAAGSVEVFVDTTRDPLATPGWYRLECSGIAMLGKDHLGTPRFIWDGCDEEERL